MLYGMIGFFLVFMFFAVLGVLRPTDTRDFLQVKCVAGTDINLVTVKCDQPERIGAHLRFTVNRSTGIVFMEIVGKNQEFFGPWFYLDRCKVASFDEWKCGGNAAGTQKIDSEYGVHNGHYFQSTTGGGSTDFYTAGISGWRVHVYDYGVFSMKSALEFE